MSKAILDLYKQGFSIKKIARDMKISVYNVTKICEPEKIELAKLRNRDFTSRSEAKQREMERLQASIPEDTRTYSQILMGEPLPGRSALDNRQPWRPRSIAIPIEKGAGE